MRMLVVSQHFWPENFRINDLVAEFVRRGHDVTVLTGLPNYPDGAVYPEYRAKPQKYSRYEGADVVRVPIVPRGRSKVRLALNFLSFMLSACSLGVWRLRGRKFDLVFTFLPSPATAAVPSTVISLRRRVPHAIWVLDIWPETLQAVGVVRSRTLLRWIGQAVGMLYRRAELVLAQSKSFIEPIAKLGGRACRVEYFPNWAEAAFDTGAVEPAPEVPRLEGAFNILFAGNVGESQDFPAILDAAELLRTEAKIRWLIVGDGRAAASVAAEIDRRGLRERVLMLGRYPLDRMASFFKHADALLVSLRDEPVFSMTIPGKLQSYMASGLPVVAMLNGEGADVVVQARCGVACAAGDSRGLANMVLGLSNMSTSELAEMGRRGRDANAAMFDRQTLISRLEATLIQLVRARQSPQG